MKKWTQIYRQSNGFTITELIIVIAIISILLSMATFGFHEWMVKSRVESQVRQMVSDFSELRVRAMTMKQRLSITVNQNSYVFRSYSSDDESVFSGTVIPNGTYPVNFALKTNSSTFYNGQVFEINQRGLLVGSPGTIYLDSDSSATIDCLTLHIVRINVGKKNADWSNCDDR